MDWGGGGKVCGCGWGRVWNTEAKTVSQPEVKHNHLHNVKHVVQSTFQHMPITFKVQTLQL